MKQEQRTIRLSSPTEDSNCDIYKRKLAFLVVVQPWRLLLNFTIPRGKLVIHVYSSIRARQKLLRYGVGVNIARFHRAAPGSIPGTGT